MWNMTHWIWILRPSEPGLADRRQPRHHQIAYTKTHVIEHSFANTCIWYWRWEIGPGLWYSSLSPHLPWYLWSFVRTTPYPHSPQISLNKKGHWPYIPKSHALFALLCPANVNSRFMAKYMVLEACKHVCLLAGWLSKHGGLWTSWEDMNPAVCCLRLHGRKMGTHTEPGSLLITCSIFHHQWAPVTVWWGVCHLLLAHLCILHASLVAAWHCTPTLIICLWWPSNQQWAHIPPQWVWCATHCPSM